MQVIDSLYIRFRNVIQLRSHDISTPEGRSLERQRRATLTILVNIAARAASFAIILLSTRFALEDLGAERFGVWMTIASLLVLLNFLDFGIGNALVGPIAKFSADADREELAKTITRGLVATIVIGLAATLILLLVIKVAPWELMFRGISATEQKEARGALILFAILIGLSLPLQTTFRIMAGLQRAYWSHALSFLISIIVLLFLILTRNDAFNISDYLLLTLGCAQIAGLCTLILLSKEGLLVFSQVGSCDFKEYRMLFSSGGLFLALQVGSLIGWGSDQVLISSLSGPADAAVYAIAFRIFMLVTIPIHIINAPLWAYYADAISKRDMQDIKKTFKFSLFSSFILSVTICFFILLIGPWLWSLISGNKIAFNGTILWSFAIWTVIDSCANAFAMLLNGANIIKEQLIGVTAFVLISIPIKILVITNYGYDVLPLLTSVIYFMTIFLIYGVFYRRKITSLLA